MILAALLLAFAQDGNRLTTLDESDPYYVHRRFPKLITPQWIGEDGVEAAIVLAIDDMRGHEKWETYLRPILERLKKIDGRAPVSIMTCTIDPNHAHLQKWIKEGLSIEVHTVDHPCPLLKDGDFLKSKSTVDRCIELMNLIPNNKPVAFRMPCCDSLNTLSPRFFAEIFNKTTPGGKFLTIDTSVFNLTTSEDPEVPRDLVLDADGKERIRKYVPFPSFVNTIENYPYPYVIGRLCWEFPCAAPSDWDAQYLNKPFSPLTVSDMKASIDAVVRKRGVFNFVFHPHGWIKPEQVVELIDHVDQKYGRKVKFLTFREAQDRLDKSIGRLRLPDGTDAGIRLIDVNNDGFLDVVSPEDTRVWQADRWIGFGPGLPYARFGVVRKGGPATAFSRTQAWTYSFGWTADSDLAMPLMTNDEARFFFFRDLDGDGVCELITRGGIYRFGDRWTKLPFSLPTEPLDGSGRDNGLRFVDLNGDGRTDVVYSNEEEWGVWTFKDMSVGWEKVAGGR
ncbi:MAG: VCBS repeat-containing protein, partial [Planctomycetes bacterium]|nr:VCBS repeat-containing protein [Planctomycetota bacterium]